MKQSLPKESESSTLLLRVFFGLYLIESAVVFAFLLTYKVSQVSMTLLPPNKFGYAAIFATIVGMAGILLVALDVAQYRTTRSLKLSVAFNLCSAVLLFFIVESVVRVLIYTRPEILNASLPRGFLPKLWQEEINRFYWAPYRRADGQTLRHSFKVFDETLGWTLGASRRSKDGLSFSSSEGIRAADVTVNYWNTSPKYRIALVGDSYTFGKSVRYEDTWGYHLEQSLGSDYQVLNFGVDGYGAGQAYLRYLKEAQEWRPDIVIFGLISHDLQRTLAVYPPIAFPSWNFPFAKPRFTLVNNELSAVNLPLPTPQELMSISSADTLPSIEFEPDFYPAEWQWRWYHRSFAVRFLQSLVPNWPESGRSVDSIRRLNSVILREFERSVIDDGSKPVFVFFPSHGAGEFDTQTSILASTPGRGKDVLSFAGVDYFDATDCVVRIQPGQRLAPDGVHYSAAVNAEIGHCIHDYLTNNKLLSGESATGR